MVISLLTSVQSFTRVFAPYAWGALSDHTGERVRLLRISAALALLVSGGLWLGQGAWWIGLVLLVLFTCTSSMMSLTEAAMAHLVAGDWGRYGRVRLWGSVGFMCTVFAAGAWFESRGMQGFSGWTAVTLSGVLLCTWWLPDVRKACARGSGRRTRRAGVSRRCDGSLRRCSSTSWRTSRFMDSFRCTWIRWVTARP